MVKAASSSLSPRLLLVTGATGLVGGYLLSRLLRHPEIRIAALVRAPDQTAAHRRLEDLGAWFGMREAFATIEAIPGDLMMADLGLPAVQLQELRSRVTDVFHAAASTAFEDDAEQTTSRTNLQSTQAILDFLPPAARLFHVSTAYIAGDIQGDFLETDLDRGQRFRNDYERSKAEAEALVQAAFACAPGRLTVLRPSIVTGERGSGRTFQFSSFYAFLRVLHKLGKRHPGTEVSIPHLPAATQNYIPVDQLADQMAEIVLDPRHWGRTYHLVNATPPTSREMQALLETALNIRIVNRDPAASPHTHDRMLGRHVARYLPYLQGEARFDMANARQLAATANPTPFDADYLRQLLDYAVAARWGRSEGERVKGEE
jgi:thioester reductase-like protein